MLGCKIKALDVQIRIHQAHQQKINAEFYKISGKTSFDWFGPKPCACVVFGSFGEVTFSKKIGVDFFRGRILLESRRFRRFLSVLGPPGYQKRLSHVPLVLGTIILVPFRPQEARLVPIIRCLVIFFINFLVKKVPRNHPKQSPTSRPKNRGPPQDSSQPFQSLKTNVSFILSLPKSSKTRKRCFCRNKTHFRKPPNKKAFRQGTNNEFLILGCFPLPVGVGFGFGH